MSRCESINDSLQNGPGLRTSFFPFECHSKKWGENSDFS
jgi:hypothetical protein